MSSADVNYLMAQMQALKEELQVVLDQKITYKSMWLAESRVREVYVNEIQSLKATVETLKAELETAIEINNQHLTQVLTSALQPEQLELFDGH